MERRGLLSPLAFLPLHGNALAEAGHSVQIFLLGEATSLMRASVAHAVVPVGWPPLPCPPRHRGGSHPVGRQFR